LGLIPHFQAGRFKPIFSSLAIKVVGFTPQKLGGSINTFDFPAGLLQNNKKVLALAVPKEGCLLCAPLAGQLSTGKH
jgi:hypothetical protein